VELLAFPDVASLQGISVTKVHQQVRDGLLVAVKNEDGIRCVPADFLQDGGVGKHLPAVIRLLRDARFTDDEIVDWLHRPDESLPGTPIEALRGNRGSEIKRRAQAAGY
jgi:hypothetical protein